MKQRLQAYGLNRSDSSFGPRVGDTRAREWNAGGDRPKKEIGLRSAPADGIVAARSAKRETRQSPFSGQLVEVYLSSL
jgi:hypothetical protein